MFRLALVIELLAEARRDLGMDVSGGDRTVVAVIDRDGELQLAEIRLDRRLHVGILQLAGKLAPIERDGAMHLAQGGGARRLALEALEALQPVGAELTRHAALDE